jgi:PAS domain S-box-containing protein
MDNLLSSSEEILFFKDRESRLLLVSDGWRRAVGHHGPPEEAIGKTDSDFFTELHAGEALADERRIIETGESMVAKLERETFADGRPDGWASTTKLPLRDDRGNIVGTWGIARNITSRGQGGPIPLAVRTQPATDVRLRPRHTADHRRQQQRHRGVRLYGRRAPSDDDQ